MSSIWVLTRGHNDYDQHGDYFVAAFATKPDVRRMADFLAKQEGSSQLAANPFEALAYVEFLLKGGGRRNSEDVWYELTRAELL